MSEASRPQAELLLLEDDAAFRKLYGGLLRDAGYRVREADDRRTGKEAFLAGQFGVVILDLMLPPDGSVETGLKSLGEFLAARPRTKVIVVSGAGDVHFMLRAVRAGAFDFLTKPVDPDALLVVVERAAARVALEAQVETLQRSLSEARPEGLLIGESPTFLRAVELAERVAGSDLAVLLTGENGTGKELFARSVHRRSRRAERPFVAVNCGALTESLLESTLFGHVRGAFTGAVRDHKGLFVEADGGTLFLDEIGDMPLALQVKLLRALESGEILPVGGDRPVYVDVRLVSATNRDLLALQAEGRFREDLYWRINGAEIRLPALRERAEDIPLLATHFLNQCAHLCVDGRAKRLSEGALEALLRASWPGNLRQLRHEMQRATVLAGDDPEIDAEDFSAAVAAPVGAAARPRGATSGSPEEATTLQEKVEALERREIAAALTRHGGNRSRTAEALGLSRQGLLKKMERYGLS
ncbi:MAG TPA: sigma-54 dependent transcriptional regulator [Polyangia bacterium]|nr:sigma-54 dependent transcriptional regulator [Polyangia bacterium]